MHLATYRKDDRDGEVARNADDEVGEKKALERLQRENRRQEE